MTLDLSQCDDRELASLAVAGQQQAFKELVGRHKGAVFRLIRNNVGDTDEALELVQESFVSAFSAINRYDPARPFRVWISRIALNKCRDWSRRRAVRSFFWLAKPIEADDILESDAHHGPSRRGPSGPDREAESRSELKLVQKAMMDMPTPLREVLTLRTIEELSQAETAAILGISEKAVETRLYRARTRLRAVLGEAEELLG